MRAFSLRQGYTPVNRANRLGVQVDDVAYPLVNRIPPRANSSMLGVCNAVAPYAPTSPYPRSSRLMMMMFGCFAVASPCDSPLIWHADASPAATRLYKTSLI